MYNNDSTWLYCHNLAKFWEAALRMLEIIEFLPLESPKLPSPSLCKVSCDNSLSVIGTSDLVLFIWVGTLNCYSGGDFQMCGSM